MMFYRCSSEFFGASKMFDYQSIQVLEILFLLLKVCNRTCHVQDPVQTRPANPPVTSGVIPTPFLGRISLKSEVPSKESDKILLSEKTRTHKNFVSLSENFHGRAYIASI